MARRLEIHGVGSAGRGKNLYEGGQSLDRERADHIGQLPLQMLLLQRVGHLQADAGQQRSKDRIEMRRLAMLDLAIVARVGGNRAFRPVSLFRQLPVALWHLKQKRGSHGFRCCLAKPQIVDVIRSLVGCQRREKADHDEGQSNSIRQQRTPVQDPHMRMPGSVLAS